MSLTTKSILKYAGIYLLAPILFQIGMRNNGIEWYTFIGLHVAALVVAFLISLSLCFLGFLLSLLVGKRLKDINFWTPLIVLTIPIGFIVYIVMFMLSGLAMVL